MRVHSHLRDPRGHGAVRELRLSRWLSLWLALGMVMMEGCGMRITPPVNPSDPVRVYVVDHGMHSSLLLPKEGGRLVEYAYGEWSYFAHDRTEWYDAMRAVLVPSRGTLGRRVIGGEPRDTASRGDVGGAERDADEFSFEREFWTRWMRGAEVHPITVDRAKVAALRDRLARRYARHPGSRHYDPGTGLHFVKDPEPYWWPHHCNTETKQWLADLGCRVGGLGVTAEFEFAR